MYPNAADIEDYVDPNLETIADTLRYRSPILNLGSIHNNQPLDWAAWSALERTFGKQTVREEQKFFGLLQAVKTFLPMVSTPVVDEPVAVIARQANRDRLVQLRDLIDLEIGSNPGRSFVPTDNELENFLVHYPDDFSFEIPLETDLQPSSSIKYSPPTSQQADLRHTKNIAKSRFDSYRRDGVIRMTCQDVVLMLHAHSRGHSNRTIRVQEDLSIWRLHLGYMVSFGDLKVCIYSSTLNIF